MDLNTLHAGVFFSLFLFQLHVSGPVSQQIPTDCTENRTVFLLFRSRTGDSVSGMGFRIGDGQRYSVRLFT